MIYHLIIEKLHYLTDDLDTLEALLNEPVQRDYEHICLALAERRTAQSYALLKKQLDKTDKYKLLAALDYLFLYDTDKDEHITLLENLLKAYSEKNDISCLKRCFGIICAHKLYINEDLLFDTAEKHLEAMDIYSVNALSYTEYSEKNLERILALFPGMSKGQRESAAKIIADRTDEKHFDISFKLLSSDSYHKVVYYAAVLAAAHRKNELINDYLQHENGHIRSLAVCYTKGYVI